MKAHVLLIKILKKLKIGNLLIPFAKLKSKKKESKLDEQDFKESLEILHKYSPDRGKSCLCPRFKNDELYDLDIIVPCYKVEKYVRECIESVLSLLDGKYKIRLILIDDGSPDNTGKILDEYASNPNIVIIHQSNKGPSSARNAGLNILNSKYVIFLDSDDALISEGVLFALETAIKDDLDIVSGSYILIDESGKQIGKKEIKKGITNKNNIRGYGCGHIIKANLFDGICFPINYWNQDTIMRQIIYMRSKKCYETGLPTYMYRMNSQGISKTSGRSPKVLDTLYVFLTLFEDQKDLGIVYDLEDYIGFLLHVKLSMLRMREVPIKIQKEAFKVWCYMYKGIKKSFCSNKKSLKNIERALFTNNFYLAYFDSVLK